MSISQPDVARVDADGDVRDSVVRVLAPVGINILTFASDREFLAALEDQSFQCLLLDVPPPTGAAPGVHRVLLERKTALPVVALVRHADAASAVEAMKTGAVDVIEKP